MFLVKNFLNHGYFPNFKKNQTLAQALDLMSKHCIPAVPVVNNEGQVIASLDVFCLANHLLQLTEGNVAIPESCFQQSINTIDVNETLHNAAYFPVDRIVTTSGGKFRGVLTRANVIRGLMREVEVFRFVLDKINIGIAMLSRQGDLLYANHFFRHVTGLNESDTDRASLENVSGIHIPIDSGQISEQRQYIRNGFYFNLEFYPINSGTRHLGTLTILLPQHNTCQSELFTQPSINKTGEGNSFSEIFPNVLLVDPNMKKVSNLALKAAKAVSSVLITGETGVGKEIVADMIHRMGPRAHKPLIKVNCAAIPDTLLESELFGYEKGAFTGATKEGKTGLIEAAGGGTLFLDEITELPLRLQAKLLRFLQNKEFYKVGGTKTQYVDLRVIAASNCNINQLIEQGTFRQDIYYRLCVIHIPIPPLRERPEDIVPLALHFLHQYCRLNNVEKQFSPTALFALQRYDWPGNVRELQHLVEQLVVLTDSPVIETDDLPAQILQETHPKEKVQVVVKELIPLNEAYQIMERELLRVALRTCKSARQIAKKLEVDHSTVLRKINRHKVYI